MTPSVNTYYAVQVELLNSSQPRPRLRATIFTGKTQREALSRARDNLINNTEHGSWPDWEEENGEKVRDDAHWIQIMEDNGFIVAAAELEQDE